MTAKVTEDAAEMVTELAGAVREFRQGAETYRMASQGDSGHNTHATVVQNASSIGVWVAMLFVNMLMLALIVILFNKLDRTQDYLNAIYMQAPHLKPPEETKP